MDKKEQAKDFEKVEGAQLSDEEQEQVQGALILPGEVIKSTIEASTESAAPTFDTQHLLE